MNFARIVCFYLYARDQHLVLCLYPLHWYLYIGRRNQSHLCIYIITVVFILRFVLGISHCRQTDLGICGKMRMYSRSETSTKEYCFVSVQTFYVKLLNDTNSSFRVNRRSFKSKFLHFPLTVVLCMAYID